MKCQRCKSGELQYGYVTIKSEGKKFDMYVCTNCEKKEYKVVDKGNK